MGTLFFPCLVLGALLLGGCGGEAYLGLSCDSRGNMVRDPGPEDYNRSGQEDYREPWFKDQFPMPQSPKQTGQPPD